MRVSVDKIRQGSHLDLCGLQKLKLKLEISKQKALLAERLGLELCSWYVAGIPGVKFC